MRKSEDGHEVTAEIIYISLGSNVGDRHDFCDRALALMNLLPHTTVTGRSGYYETEPVGSEQLLGPMWFYNGVVRLETQLPAERVFDICQETERSLGRLDENRQGPRTMDLDILFFGQHTIHQPNLTIPHPRLHLRRFILTPMVELNAEWIHPVLNKSMEELLQQVSDSSQVQKLDVIPGSRYPTRPTCSPPLSH